MAEDRSPVPSPCVGVCALNQAGDMCVGCYRSIGEIRRWRDANEAEKRRIRRSATARQGAVLRAVFKPEKH
ncbi:MAG: DUF1289 domain-containing protein [Alphaproteobacteria bacterium]